VRPLLRAELLKLRTTRTFVALVGSALALSLLVVVLTTTIPHDLVRQDVRELFTADFSSLFILLLGVMGMAGEWRHRTITGTVLASANRLRLLAAKIISYAIAGMVLSLIVTVTIMLVGTAILSLRDLPALGFGDLLDVLWRNLVVAAFAGAFGVVVGALVRNQVVAIVGLLVFAFAVEPALLAVAPDVGRFGPTSGAPNAVIDTGSFGGETPLAPGIAILVLAGWVGAGFAAAQQMLRRRDLV
jgi:hypothetical protein